MKKKTWSIVNLVAVGVLAFIIVFNLVWVYTDHVYEVGRQYGVNEWSHYIEQQEQLKAINALEGFDVVNSEQFR